MQGYTLGFWSLLDVTSTPYGENGIVSKDRENEVGDVQFQQPASRG